jgi:hypothetical protein
MGEAGLERGPISPVDRMADQSDFRTSAHDLRRAVPRAIIDHDHFPVCEAGLLKRRADGPHPLQHSADGSLLVIGGDHNR